MTGMNRPLQFGKGSKRKLPFTDEQISAAYAAGIKQTDMARFMGVDSSSISSAISRARDNLGSARSLNPDFIDARTDPREHRDTGDGSISYTVPPLDYFIWQAQPLEIEECRDFFREWGVEA